MSITEIPNENLEKVSRQFALLMVKAKATDSSDEAENCVSLAQGLLWKYDLEEAQLLSLTELKKRQRNHIKDKVKVGKDVWVMDGKFNSRDWKASLLSTVSKNFFCRLRPSRYAEYDTIVGEPQNVQMVKQMFAYLEQQIRAVRKLAYKVAEPDLPRAISKRSGEYTKDPQQFAVLRWKDSFANGAVQAICQRLEATQKENVETADASTVHVAGEITNGIGSMLVAQIYSDLDEAYYEFFPEEHPNAVKLREYQNLLAYNKRMEELKIENAARAARIEAGEEQPEPVKPHKEYKRRGRKPMWRSTENREAYAQGRQAGNSMQLHTAVKAAPAQLNK